MSSICSAFSTSGSARIFPQPRRIHPVLRPDQTARRTAQARRPHHAPGPDQSWRRNRQRPRRQRSQCDPRSSHQRPRRAHGRPLPLRGSARQRIVTTAPTKRTTRKNGSYLPGFEPAVSTFREELAAFAQFGTKTAVSDHECGGFRLPVFENEFWTAKQRDGHSLQEVSYRACFKPQLPAFFISRFTTPGEAVYDPFMGRGTTLVEASLLGRRPVGNDVNPLSQVLVEPRLAPPPLAAVAERLAEIPFAWSGETDEDLARLLSSRHPARDLRLARLVPPASRRRRTGSAGPLVANGRHQPPHRPQCGLLLRLHASAESSHQRDRPAAHQ